MTRVPATWREAQAVLAQADPQPMAPLPEGYRDHVRRSRSGGVEPRWVLLHAAARQPHAPRPLAQPLLQLSQPEVNAFTHLGRTALACTAEAPQARAPFAPGVQATFVTPSTVRPTPRDAQRGRPGQGPPPAQVVDELAGARALRIASRRALIDRHGCFLLATHALDDALLPPPEVFAGYQGQAQAERGFRFLKDPQCLASARYLKQPARMMALLMGMTLCLVV
jgi:hypothetical protein